MIQDARDFSVALGIRFVYYSVVLIANPPIGYVPMRTD